jgi:hypothetical protein
MQSKQGSASFLKKRLPAGGIKKLLLVGRRAVQRQGLKSKSFFASFFSKKEVLLPVIMGFDPALRRHSRESGNLLSPGAPPKKIPAFAGMTLDRSLAKMVDVTFAEGPA